MTYLIVFLAIPLILGFGAQAWVKRSFADRLQDPGVVRHDRRAGEPADARRKRHPRRVGRGHLRTTQRPLRPPFQDDAAVRAGRQIELGGRGRRGRPRDRARDSRTTTTRPDSGCAARSSRQSDLPPTLDADFFLGLISDPVTVAWVGAILFGFVVLFQLVTLPVEFGASHKAHGPAHLAGDHFPAAGAGRPQGADRRRA